MNAFALLLLPPLLSAGLAVAVKPYRRVVGWANAAVRGRRLLVATGFAHGPETSDEFRRELAAERDRMATFLDL